MLLMVIYANLSFQARIFCGNFNKTLKICVGKELKGMCHY